jgi:hypothetical protein
MSKPSPESKKLDQLIRNWERYRELVAPAIAGEDESDRREKSFLALKAELAAQIQWLSETLPRSMAYESHQSAEAMADLIHRHVKLTTYDMDTRWEPMDFETTWHQYFIYLNRLRGTELVPPKAEAESAATKGSRGFRLASGFGWALSAAVAIIIVMILTSAAGLRWGSSGPRFEPPANLQEAWVNAGNTLSALWAGPSLLLEPLTTAYGSMMTIGVLAGIAVLGGVFFVARGQQ